MKNCPVCEKQLPDEAAFCVYCMTQLAPVVRVEPAPPKRKSPVALACALLVVTACLVAALAVLFLRKPEVVYVPRADYLISSSDAAPVEPSLNEQFAPLREEFIQALKTAQFTRDSAFSGGYDQRLIYSTTSSTNESSFFTKQLVGPGVVYIQLSHLNRYVLCEVLGTTDAKFPNQGNGLDNAYGLMQSLYDVRTGTSGTTIVYDFLTDDETYPFTRKDDDWSQRTAFDDSYWLDAQLTDSSVVTYQTKEWTEVGDMMMVLRLRTRDYGSIVYYDIQFEMN